MACLLDVNVLVAIVVPEHEQFWPDASSPAVMTEVRTAQTARQITDRYLLGLVRRNGGKLVTFDAGIATVGGDDVIHLLPRMGKE